MGSGQAYRWSKRALDVSLSAIALLLTSWLGLIVAVIVRCSSPGPILFRQTRLGRDRRPFQILKFRTMYERPAADSGPLMTASGDSRITPAGRWLRSLKLDEWPQLWNVLRGDMSLVGPRPEVPELAVFYPPEAEALFSVRPGITDLATLQFRQEEEVLAEAGDRQQAYREVVLPVKVELACRYAREASLRSDLSILIRTAWALTLGRWLSRPDDGLARQARAEIRALQASAPSLTTPAESQP